MLEMVDECGTTIKGIWGLDPFKFVKFVKGVSVSLKYPDTGVSCFLLLFLRWSMKGQCGNNHVV